MSVELSTNNVYVTILKIISSNKESPVDVKLTNLTSYSLLSFYDFGALRIKCGKKVSYLMISEQFKYLLTNYPLLNTTQIKSEAPWIRILISTIDDLFNLQPLFLSVYDESFYLGTSEFFGCCSRYVECSDNLKCVQSNMKLARGCMYKRNMQNGKIFYGVNKNN